MRHLRNLYDLSSDDVGAILDRSFELKTAHRNGDRPDVLRGRMLSLLFEKPSLRTRVSFEAAMTHLGGGSVFQSTKDAGLNGRESLPDVAAPPDWRDFAICEMDYSFRTARQHLGLGPQDTRCFMVRTGRWKYIWFTGFRPQLFDLENDPSELDDLGDDPGYATIRGEMHERLFASLASRRTRRTYPDERIEKMTNTAHKRGILYGQW